MQNSTHSPVKVIFSCMAKHPRTPHRSCAIYLPIPGEAGEVSFEDEDPDVVQTLITITGPIRDPGNKDKFFGSLDVYKIEAKTELSEMGFKLAADTEKNYPSIRLSSTFQYNDEPKYGPLGSGEAVSLKVFLLSGNVDVS